MDKLRLAVIVACILGLVTSVAAIVLGEPLIGGLLVPYFIAAMIWTWR